jgi:hypothetical protein
MRPSRHLAADFRGMTVRGLPDDWQSRKRMVVDCPAAVT